MSYKSVLSDFFVLLPRLEDTQCRQVRKGSDIGVNHLVSLTPAPAFFERDRPICVRHLGTWVDLSNHVGKKLIMAENLKCQNLAFVDL